MRSLVVRLWCAWLLAALSAPATPGNAVCAGSGAVVALHPVAVPHGLELPATGRAALETEIARRLEAAGYTVVPAAESGAAWDRLLREVGGFYDPVTGDTVAVKYRAVRDGTVRGLAARHGATLWLRPSLEVVVVPWKRGKASWDGATDGVSPIGKGHVPALTLVVAVEDTSGVVVADGRGGIQVLSKVKGGGRFVDEPQDRLLADTKRLAKAAGLALAAFLGGRP